MKREVCKFESSNSSSPDYNSRLYLLARWPTMVRSPASQRGGSGSNPGQVMPKTLNKVLVAASLGIRHREARAWLSRPMSVQRGWAWCHICFFFGTHSLSMHASPSQPMSPEQTFGYGRVPKESRYSGGDGTLAQWLRPATVTHLYISIYNDLMSYGWRIVKCGVRLQAYIYTYIHVLT